MIYGAFLINVWIGRRMLRSVTPMRVGGAAFACSLQFFVLTVFASWAVGVAHHSAFFAPGFAGLMSTYVEALPFWGRTLAGDLLFSGALFGMYELLNRTTPTSPQRLEAGVNRRRDEPRRGTRECLWHLMRRLVSLISSATEMVGALGALDLLVGRSHECDYPPSVLGPCQSARGR